MSGHDNIILNIVIAKVVVSSTFVTNIKMMSGFDYVYAAKSESEQAIVEQIKTYAVALVSTVKDLTQNLEQYAAPLRAAAAATEQLRDTITDQIHKELERRREDAKILAIRVIYLQPTYTIQEVTEILSETLALPEVYSAQVLQALLDANLIELRDGILHPVPLST